MSQLNDLYAALRTALIAAYPSCLVTRNLKSFDQHGDTVLTNGVFTILANGVKGMSSPIQLSALEGQAQSLLLYQFKLAEGSTGDQVEAAELAKFDELISFFDAQTGILKCFDIADFNQSAQLEMPYGWCLFHLIWSDFD